MRSRGRGSRYTRADCPICGAMCEAPATSADAHRMWAKRHAERTGHAVLVKTTATRSYGPTEGGEPS